jgi:hypothetical protein
VSSPTPAASAIVAASALISHGETDEPAVRQVPAGGLPHEVTRDAPRLAVFVKRDLQALVSANYLVPLARARGCAVLLLVCDFVMARERSCHALRSHIGLERDVFFDAVETLYEVRAGKRVCALPSAVANTAGRLCCRHRHVLTASSPVCHRQGSRISQRCCWCDRGRMRSTPTTPPAASAPSRSWRGGTNASCGSWGARRKVQTRRPAKSACGLSAQISRSTCATT